MSAGSVAEARLRDHWARGGATPTPALQQILVQPVPVVIARRLIEWEQYPHSLPGGTCLAFGTFIAGTLGGNDLRRRPRQRLFVGQGGQA
jgi:hypothetical protein